MKSRLHYYSKEEGSPDKRTWPDKERVVLSKAELEVINDNWLKYQREAWILGAVNCQESESAMWKFQQFAKFWVWQVFL